MRQDRDNTRWIDFRKKAKRQTSLHDQYPLIFAFGATPIRFLEQEEEKTVDVHGRIKSVWPFLVKLVLVFAETMRPRDLANYDPEDVLSELYVALVERDAKWIPERGRYLTFAGQVTLNELHAIRDRSHTVHGPRNSSSRLKQYRLRDDDGSLSSRRRKTYTDILRALGEQQTFSTFRGVEACDRGEAEDTLDVVTQREEEMVVFTALAAGLGQLTPFEATVTGLLHGLWGQEPTSILDISRRSGKTQEAVRLARDKATDKIREHLADIGHPAAYD